MKKHVGSLKNMNLVTISHLHQAHPTFASATCLCEEIMSSIYSKIANMSDAKKTALTIPTNCKTPDMYVSTSKISGTYLNDTISSNVAYLQAERGQASLLRSCIKK
jgi:hypothetical protein